MKLTRFSIFFLLQLWLCFYSYDVIAQIDGCTDPLANNYNAIATNNDGSCTYDVVNISPVNSTQLDAALNETSGLIMWNSEVWTHLDGGNPTELFNLGLSDFTTFSTLNLPGVTNVDWEDISQDDDYIYIGDFGNNARGNRTDLKIYRIEKNSIIAGTPSLDIINFSYSDQTDFTNQGGNNTDFDCEALIVTDSSIYLFTKEWVSQETTVYSMPKTPGSYSATNEGSYNVNGLITGATYAEEKQLVVLSGYSSTLQPFIVLLYDFTENNFFNGNKRKINLNLPFHQVEGITTQDGINYFISNERVVTDFFTIQPKIHKLNLSDYLLDYLGYETSGNSSNFSQPTAWVPEIVPPESSDIKIAHDLTLDQDYTALNLQIDDNITLTTISGFSLSVQNNLSLLTDSKLNLEPTAVLNVDGNISNHGTLHFKSDLSGTAQFNEFTGLMSGSGQTEVERFIPAGINNRRAYRLLSSAVNSVGSFNLNWQEAASNITENPNPGFGTHITGSISGADGFDATSTGNPSVFTFNNAFVASGSQTQANAWTSLPNTNTRKLLAGEAYLTFIRGDRSIDLTTNSPIPTNTTLRTTGDLFTGSRTFSSDYNLTSPTYGLSDQANYFSLVGNPYQAIVDFNNLDLVNVNPIFYWVWDPNLGTRGNYTTVTLSDGSNNTSSTANEFVQPGQSFFVQTIADGAASLTFNEADKVISGGATAVFSQQTNPSIKVLLYSASAFNDGNRESDAVLVNFTENANNDVDLYDAVKLEGLDENLARLIGNELLSIENRALPDGDESLGLSISGYTQDHYTFVVQAENIQGNFEAYLFDNYTGIETFLNEGNTEINFNVDVSTPETTASDRFSLLFNPQTLSLDEQVLNDNFKVYPNPTQDVLYLQTISNFWGNDAQIYVYDVTGRQVFYKKMPSLQYQNPVDLNILSPGFYLLKLETEGLTETFKVQVR